MRTCPDAFSLCHLSCYNRCCRHQAAEQEVLSHGVFHSSQKQYEGDPCLLHTHHTPVPLLCPAPPNVSPLPGRTSGRGCAPGPAHPPAHAARLGVHTQQQRLQPWGLGGANWRSWGSPWGYEPGFEQQSQPSIHPECLWLSEPLHQPAPWHGTTPVPLANISSESALHLPLPSDSSQQRLWQLLLRAGGFPVQKMPLDMTQRSQ